MLPFVLSTTPEINKKISPLISSSARFDIDKFQLEELFFAMKKSPKTEDCYNGYAGLAILAYFYDKNIKKAIKCINPILYLCNELPKTYITAAYFYLLDGDKDKTKSYLSRAITYNLDESDILRITDPIINLHDADIYRKFLNKFTEYKGNMAYNIIETEYNKLISSDR